jgi:hypothetical protein
VNYGVLVVFLADGVCRRDVQCKAAHVGASVVMTNWRSIGVLLPSAVKPSVTPNPLAQR